MVPSPCQTVSGVTGIEGAGVSFPAHNATADGSPAYFKDLHKLKTGDEVFYTTALGERRYEVAQIIKIMALSTDCWMMVSMSGISTGGVSTGTGTWVVHPANEVFYTTALGERRYEVAQIIKITDTDWDYILDRPDENRLTLGQPCPAGCRSGWRWSPLPARQFPG